MSIISQILSGLQSDQNFESKSLDVSALPSLPLSQKRKLPEVPAIYFCISETEEILYIGRTKNLSNRWIAHHRYSELKGIKKVKLAWLEVSDPALLPQIESALIEYFKPPFNGLKVPDLVTENIKKEKSIRIQKQISLESEAQIEALEQLSKELGFKFGVKTSVSGLIQAIADGKIPLMPLADRKQLPEVSAVYFCYTDKGEIIYIGESANLKNRWSNHNKLKEIQDFTKDAIGIAWIAIEVEKREEVERILINLLKPPLNRKIIGLEKLEKQEIFVSLFPEQIENLREQAAKFGFFWANKPSTSKLFQAIANNELTLTSRTEPMTQIEREALELIYHQQPFSLSYIDIIGRLCNFEFLYATRIQREHKYYLEGWTQSTQDNLDIPELAHNWSLRFDRINDPKLIPLDNAQWRHAGLDTIEVGLEFKGALAYGYSLKENDIGDTWEGSSRKVTRRITNTFWFVREILSYGRNCIVVSPENVVAKIKEELNAMVGNY